MFFKFCTSLRTYLFAMWVAIPGSLIGQSIGSVEDVNRLIQQAEVQYCKMIKSIPSYDQYPRSTNPDGSLHLVSSGDWTSGFFPGTLWYLYEYTGSEQILNYAKYFTAAIKAEQNNTGTHDLGFMLGSSFGNGYRLIDEPEYEKILIQSAISLSQRFNDKVGCIRSWDFGSWTFPVIIDNMMNLEIMFLVSEISGNTSFKEMAIRHADHTLVNHFRPDYSSYHVVDYSDVTGSVISKTTHQGFSSESAWARGQSWGLYGYTMCYRYTHDPKYLHLAEQIALFIIHHRNFPEDMIPYWDFDAPDIPNTPRDASAAAVMCSALFELSGYTMEYRDTFLAVAKKQLNVLSSPQYFASPDTNNNFILMHSTGNFPGNSEVNAPLNYADYYYIEALTRYRRYLNQAPRGDFQMSDSGIGLMVNFDASISSDPDGDSIVYRWDFNDGHKGYSLSPQISHTYSNPGDYTITLVTSDKWGGVDSVQHTIHAMATADQSLSKVLPVAVWPNPAGKGFNLKMEHNYLPASLSLIDMKGDKNHIGINLENTWIGTENWGKGVYIFLIQTNQGIHKERMIIN